MPIGSRTDLIFSVSTGKKKGKKQISFDELACEHHEVGIIDFQMITV